MYQVRHDHRSFQRNLSNCVQKPDKVRTSTGFEPVTSRAIPVRRSNQLSYETTDVGRSSHMSFIAQLVRASHRYHEVTGSNPVEVLTFSGFFTQLLDVCKLLNFVPTIAF